MGIKNESNRILQLGYQMFSRANAEAAIRAVSQIELLHEKYIQSAGKKPLILTEMADVLSTRDDAEKFAHESSHNLIN